MANRLMFEVGVSDSVQNLDKLKKELDQFIQHYSKDTAIKLKVDIENLQAVTSALSKIGDTPQLRNLRQEIESINKEFSKLAVGAGGVGDLGVRKMNQEVEDLKQKWDSAVRLMARYNQELELARRNRDRETNLTDRQTYTDQINKLKENIKTQQEVINSAKSAYDNAVKNAGQLVDVNTRAEASFREVKRSIDEMKQSMSSMNVNVNIGQDFAKWTSEVQAVSASVRELVEQLQKMNTATSAQSATETTKAQTQAVLEESDAYKQLAKWREQAEKFFKTNNPIADQNLFIGHAVNGIVLGDKTSLETIKQHIYLQKDENKLLAERKLLEEQIAKSNIRKHEQKTNYQDVLGVYDKVLNALQQIKQTEQTPTPKGGLFDPQKFTTLQEAIDKIIAEINRLQQAFTHLGQNGSLSNLSTMINGLAVTLSSLGNAIKIQPLDDQVKTLLERCEKAEAKLREVGDAARYLNEQAGKKTQQKAGTIMDITGTEAEQINKVSSTAERFMRLLVEIENQMARIGKIQALGEQSGFSPTLLKNAQNQLEALKKMVESTIKGTPIAEGLIMSASDSQLAQFIQQFGLLKAMYRDVVKEADRFNKANEKDSLKQKNQELREQASNMKAAENEARRLTETISNLEALANKAGALGVDTTKIRSVIDSLKSYRDTMNDIAQGNTSFNTKATKISEPYLQLKRDVKEAAQEIKKNMSAALKPDTEQANAFREYASLIRQISSLTKTAFAADKFGIDTTHLTDLINKLTKYAQVIEAVARSGGAGFNNWKLSNVDYLNVRANANTEQASMNAKIAEEKAKNAAVTNQLTASEQQLANAIKGSTDSMRGQSQILSDLKMLATQYVSVWGAQQFIHNIIELGGQLEQQRLSIGAILQDTAQANHLFSQIKDLAIKSPFGVQQLDAMSKQLSAYGFQYSELYEWTKRLADISAATGTSVDRLALALGHVRSEGALSGYTLRQFSMGNIPLLQKLSENLGKTKQEIRKMTRNKEIGYEDVLNVLKQLTDESGMFYQAQETMAQALNAKFKNLRDSFQIMYSEMAEGAPGDFLKGFATTMTDLSRQWQVLLPMIGAAGAMWAMNKASAALVNVELAKMATLTNANTLASSKYSVAQLRQIANWEKMPHAMVRARLALQGFRTSLLSLGKMIFSWPTAIFAAIEALTYMWAKQSQESEKAKEMTEVLTNTALESQKNIKKQLENISPYEKGMSDSEMKTGIESMTESIKNYGVNAQEVLEKVYGKDAEGRVMSMADRYKTLREELEKTAKVYKEMQRTSSGWEFGIEYTDGGWFDDDIQTDLTNYANAVKEYDDAFTTMTANYASAVNKALEQVKKASPEFKRIADGLNSDAERVKWLYENQGQYGGIYNMFKGALHREDANAGGGVLGYQLGDNLRKAEREAMKELDEFFVGIEAKYKEYGYNFTEDGKYLSEVQVGNLLRQSKEWLEKHPEWERIYDVIWDKLNKRWGLPIVPDVTPVEEELPQWLEDFQKELDKEKTGITLTANMSMEQIVDEMKKAYDQAQTTINKLGPVAMTAKINVVGMSDEDLEAYNNPLSPNYNPEMYNWLKQLKGAYTKRDIVDNAAKKRGLKLKGMKKDGTHKAEKQNQENAKAVREQVRVIKEAADAFQYWREKVGDKGAWEHVKSEFGDVLNKIGITADNIEDVRGHLKRIPEMKEYKAITDKKVKTEIKKETAKEEDQYKRKDFERDTERFLSKTQIQLDNLTRRWEMFNSVREATGDVKLAIELSGADYAEGQTRNLADSVKQKIEEEFAAVGAVQIPFDIYLSDKEIEDSIKAAMPQANETQIKAFVEDYKKWRDLQRDVLKTDVQTFTQIIGSSQDYATQLQKITTEYDKQKESLDALLKLYNSGQVDENGNRRGINADQYLKAMQQIDANRDLKVLKLSDQYAMFMAGSFGVMKDNVVETAKLIESKLNNAMKAGVIDAKTYADEMRKVRDLMDKYQEDSFFGKESPFVAFMNGGLKGANDYVKNAIQALESKKEPLTAEEQKQLKTLKDLQNSLSKTIGVLSSFGMVLSIAQGVVDGFASAAQSLSEMFDALGKEGAANFWSDVSDSIKAGSSFLQPVNNILQNAMSGKVSGVLSSAISAPVDMIAGPIKGFAQLHDKKRERQLEALRRDVQQIDNTLKLIKSLRERSLGYDNGNLRREMAQLYANNSKTINTIFGKISVNDAASEAMSEYYSRGGIRGNGYTQELEALKKQREDYQKMYDAENDKKKSSAEALEEYKVKMAELDEQIKYYIEDLSKELWGIDFQSWADQISDALWTAFENGEDAVEAFHDTAKDIIADVAKKMMNIHLIEPLFNQLEEQLFGKYDAANKRYTGGAIKYDSNGNINMQESEPDVLRILGQFFGEGGSMEKNVEAAEQFYNWVQDITGLDFSSDDSKSTGTSIKSITEETADLLASYVNGIRADVSVIRSLQGQYFPMYYDALTRGNGSLTNIESHTAAIMRSNDAIQRAVDDLYRDFHGLRTSAWKMPIA